ncbi:MAG TPA: hypothetical protein VFR97_09775 [Capillimicrobium sp.]|nr:hypothetical protein [Capillimicrobium sp.]
MPAHRTLLLALAGALATALLAAAPAGASLTVTATVVGPAAQHGHTAVLPVLLAPPGARAYGRPVLRVAIRGARPIHWGSIRLRVDRLRPGDRLGLRLDGRRARLVRLRQSGLGDSFQRVRAGLQRTAKRSRNAIADLEPLVKGRDDAAHRDRVRDRLSGLLAHLMSLRGNLGTTLERLREVGPSTGARHRAVRRAQRRYASRIAAVRRQAGVAVRRTRAALAALGAGPPIGESGTQPVIPIPGPPQPGVVGTASELSSSLLELLTRLGVLTSPQLASPGDVVHEGAPSG